MPGTFYRSQDQYSTSSSDTYLSLVKKFVSSIMSLSSEFVLEREDETETTYSAKLAWVHDRSLAFEFEYPDSGGSTSYFDTKSTYNGNDVEKSNIAVNRGVTHTIDLRYGSGWVSLCITTDGGNAYSNHFFGGSLGRLKDYFTEKWYSVISRSGKNYAIDRDSVKVVTENATFGLSNFFASVAYPIHSDIISAGPFSFCYSQTPYMTGFIDGNPDNIYLIRKGASDYYIGGFQEFTIDGKRFVGIDSYLAVKIG